MKEFPDEFYKCFIFYPPAQDVDKVMVVNGIKIGFYITLDKSFDSGEVVL